FFQTALKEIELPGTLVEIGQSAFRECPLANIKCEGTTPPVCADKDVFSDEAYENTVVTVPPGSKKTYRNTEVWKLFKNLQSEGGGFKVTVTYDDTFGRVTLNESTATSITVDEDEPLTVAITPAEGYKVAALTVNGADMLASLADNRLVYESIDANLDINVEFSLMTFAVTVPQSLAGGRIVINGADEAPATVDYGSRLEITPVADRGHELSSLAVNGTDISSSLDENGSYVIDRVTTDITIEAAFSPIVYTVKAVNATPYGTITLNGEAGDCRIEFGKPLAVGVTPRDEGCYLVSLAVDGVDVTDRVVEGVYTIESVEGDMTVEAAFAIHTYTVSFSFDPAMGSIVPDMPADGLSVTVEHGSTLSLAITPAEGYETAAVTLDGRDVTDRVASDGTLTIENITADHSVEASFEVKRVILTVLGLEGGRLAMRYDYATEVTLLIEPEEGWTFHSLTVGYDTVTELDSDNSYTTRPLTDHTDVSVVFRKASESGIGAIDTDSDNITVYARSRTVTIEG
ncbi:MAG: leucine-rich repeat domain-containing protein, partial [Muribaculum intestinale]|nr:leucine-rich repeat domain-containing protein [Muribaculum intestinale]